MITGNSSLDRDIQRAVREKPKESDKPPLDQLVNFLHVELRTAEQLAIELGVLPRHLQLSTVHEFVRTLSPKNIAGIWAAERGCLDFDAYRELLLDVEAPVAATKQYDPARDRRWVSTG